MNTVPKPETPPKRRGQRAWTDAQRAEQAAKLRTRQIWLKSTGPRTPHGKSISRLNALTHGATSRPAKDFMAHFKTYHAFIRLCWAKRAELIRIQKNELIDIERQICDGMTFYGITGQDDRLNKGKITPFRGASGRKGTGMTVKKPLESISAVAIKAPEPTFIERNIYNARISYS